MSMALVRAFEARNPSAVDVGSLLREMRLALRETCEVGRRAWRGEWDVLLGSGADAGAGAGSRGLVLVCCSGSGQPIRRPTAR